jgi:hypothetical protein
VAETDQFCTKCGVKCEATVGKRPAEVRIGSLILRLAGTAGLLLLLGVVSNNSNAEPFDNIAQFMLIVFAITIVTYFMFRSYWPWAPLAFMRKCQIVILGTAAIAGGWFYLDSGPLTSFGPSRYSSSDIGSSGGIGGKHCTFHQDSYDSVLWKMHSFSLAETEDGRCPYIEEDDYLTKDSRRVLDNNGEPILLYRRMVKGR